MWFFFNKIIKSIQGDQDTIVLKNDVSSLEDINNLSKRRLIEASRNLQYLKENNTKELGILKATNEQELNFFNRNLEAIKVCIY